MKIYLDADASPVAVREILYRASERLKVPLVLVANTPLKIPQSSAISFVHVSAGFDEADDWITGMVEDGDLVITEDVPLADRVVSRGGFVITTRGKLYTRDTIKERLVMRDLMEELRGSGIDTGGPAPFSPRDRNAFAACLDRFLSANVGK
ncbi:MAG: YaiI/YqxD family protein [Chrysiogenales bacterium]|nr:MAG: YaiI/YqxD family protein [Chrysiogenales bacterium]